MSVFYLSCHTGSGKLAKDYAVDLNIRIVLPIAVRAKDSLFFGANRKDSKVRRTISKYSLTDKQNHRSIIVLTQS